MAELLYSGKVKQVWSTDDPDVIEFRYTNQISVFDQIIPSLIPRKGESLNRTSCHWFKLVEDAGICDTHIIEMNAPDRVLARRFEVIREHLLSAKVSDKKCLEMSCEASKRLFKAIRDNMCLQDYLK